MERVYLPEQEMLPHIWMVRLYDTEKVGVIKHSPKRRVESYELSLYLTDGGMLEIDNKQFPIRRGDVRFSRPGEIISSSPHYRCYTVFFNLGEEGYLYFNEFLDAIPGFFSTNCAQQNLFEQMIKLYIIREPGNTAHLNSLLLQVLSTFYRMFKSEHRYSEPVKRCIAFMQEHMSEKVSLELLGEVTGYSALHVLRIFRNDTGISPHEYLAELRMAKARQMLAETSIPISRLASECGFSSESYFQTVFKKTNGMTPGEYRKSSLLL